LRHEKKIRSAVVSEISPQTDEAGADFRWQIPDSEWLANGSQKSAQKVTFQIPAFQSRRSVKICVICGLLLCLTAHNSTFTSEFPKGGGRRLAAKASLPSDCIVAPGTNKQHSVNSRPFPVTRSLSAAPDQRLS
jgi:hypothetical protein